MKKTLIDKQIPLHKLTAGDTLNIEEGLTVQVIYPDAKAAADDVNGQSLVLRLGYGSFSTLLTGDLQKEGLQSLVAAGVDPVTAIKVPHHGSKGSLLPALYEHTQPGWAVISVGANNRFGHPHPAVLEELEQRNIKVYRTDLDGAITIKSDGQTSSISSYRQFDNSL